MPATTIFETSNEMSDEESPPTRALATAKPVAGRGWGPPRRGTREPGQWPCGRVAGGKRPA